MPVWKFVIGIVEEEISPGVGLGASADLQQTVYNLEIIAGVGLGADAENNIEAFEAIYPGVGLAAAEVNNIEASEEIFPGVGLSPGVANFNWAGWLAAYTGRYTTLYYFTLTGSADGVADITIPMSTFNYRLRDGDPGYLQVTLPGVEYADAIAARSNGEMVVEMAFAVDGVEHHREELARIDLEEIRVDEGTTSRTITLTGHRTESWSAKIVTLAGITYKAEYGGKRRVRCAEPDMYLRPGDTVRVGSESWTAGYVQTVIGNRVKWMEVVEADA